MATEPRNPDREPVREREVIVTDGGRRGGGMSGAIAAVVAVIVIALIAWLAISMIGGSDGDVDMEAPNVEVPDDVNVDVNEGG